MVSKYRSISYLLITKGEHSNFILEKHSRCPFNHMMKINIVVMELTKFASRFKNSESFLKHSSQNCINLFTRKYKTQIEKQPPKQLACILQKHQRNEIKCPKLFQFQGY